MSKSKSRSFKVTCPCCDTVLHLDRKTAAILLEERTRKGPAKTLEQAARDVASRHKQARAQLDQAMEERRHKDEIMEKKFEEAKRKAEKDDTVPPRPFDFD